MRKKIPIGFDDYKQFIDENCYFVDKTLLIKDLLSSSAGRAVTLMPRPRRFGKTLNMTMLKYFFERTEEDHAYLFKDKKIWKEKEREHFGQYPVIFLTLKNIKGASWEEVNNKFGILLFHEFARHKKIIGQHLEPEEKQVYQSILDMTASPEMLQEGLLFLSRLLHRVYQKKAIIIIDEYDTPIVGGYSEGYYGKVVNFMRGFMTASFKSNPHLERGFITGISRVAKESIFSALNNLAVFGLFNAHTADKFGFTDAEVKDLLAYYNLSDKAAEYKQWYDGYNFGDKKNMYNPWSIFECMDNQNIFRAYWGKTSNNALIKELVLLRSSSALLKQQLEGLLEGRTFVQRISEGIIYPGIERSSDAIWSLLLYTGYLTFIKRETIVGEDYCTLAIPNYEAMKIFGEVIREALETILPGDDDKVMINALIAGNVKQFSKYLQKFLISSLSSFDKDRQHPENSYHMLMLGLSYGPLQGVYRPKSNPESGYGRTDLLLIPHNTKRPGIVIEFKKAEPRENLSRVADTALAQIEDKQYVQELFDLGCRTVYAYGMAFSGKKTEVKMAQLNF